MNAVNLFVSGVMTPEALAAARSMEAEGVYVNVFVLTSADRIYAGHKKAKKEGRPSRLEMMVGDEHRDNAVVSVLDGHSLALSSWAARSALTRDAWARISSVRAASRMKSTTPSRSARRTSKKRAGRLWGEGVRYALPGCKYVHPIRQSEMTLSWSYVVFSVSAGIMLLLCSFHSLLHFKP